MGVAALPAHASDDDFADGAIAPAWTLLEDAPDRLTLAEQNGRLEVLADDPANNAIDALYLSDGPAGFRLSTAVDFELTLGYALTGFDDAASGVGDALGLTFGVGRDLDGTDSAAIGFGVSRQAFLGGSIVGTALGAAYRVDDAQTEQVLSLFNPAAATFRIAYDAQADDLILGVTDASVAAFVLEDTVRGVWDADALFVSFGARGGGFSLGSGDAWLDDFRVVSGELLPLTAGLIGDFDGSGQVEQGDLNLVLNNWGQNRGDWANSAGLTTVSVDQEELNAVLNHWGDAAAPGFAGSTAPEPSVAVALLGGLGWGLCGRRGLRRRRYGYRSNRDSGVSLAFEPISGKDEKCRAASTAFVS
ncbi:MAG: hypothetical protein AAGE65_04995 [Planctomycetota bacterium]